MDIKRFLEELTERVKKRFKGRINFILLLGSAARGDFKEGVSDVDLIIEVKDRKTKEEMERYLEKVFWELDKKHKTRIREAIEGEVLSVLSKEVKLYKPYEIFVEGDIDWKNGEIKKELGIAAPFISKAIFAEKIKREGKILYGKDIRKEVRGGLSFKERIKLIVVPYLLSILGFLVSLFFPDTGVKLSIKALFYGLDDHLLFVRGKLKVKKEDSIKELKRVVRNYSTRLLREAMMVKYNFDKYMKEWTYIDKVFFCFESIFNILYNDLVSILYYLRIAKK